MPVALSAKRSLVGHAGHCPAKLLHNGLSDIKIGGRNDGQERRQMALIGYARVSTAEQDTALQTDALRKAGCERVFEDTASGAKADRPGLADALAYLRDGDVLAVWRLDRLGRSMPHLIETIGALEGHCCKVSDEAAFCLIQRPYISKTLLTRRISPRGSP
nr:recombinase family protein [Klebsiella pneumoniae]